MAGFLEVFVDQTVVLDSANNVESATAVITCPSEPEISFEADITDKVRIATPSWFPRGGEARRKSLLGFSLPRLGLLACFL